MTDEQKRAATRRVLELLGWTDLQWADDDVDDFGVWMVNNWHGVPAGGRKHAYAPKPFDDLDVVADALPEDASINIQCYMSAPEDWRYTVEIVLFSAGAAYDTRGGHGATRQLAAGASLLAYLEAREGAPPCR